MQVRPSISRTYPDEHPQMYVPAMLVQWAVHEGRSGAHKQSAVPVVHSSTSKTYKNTSVQEKRALPSLHWHCKIKLRPGINLGDLHLQKISQLLHFF